ncbi:uncharacterized protein LOC127750613 [Frankliniella occidentalis]|uniref:Uncharacterized protein LOC127750613 n=1 Tax=Frankliniella occidentalis TaxID=133901 RepID=A0A9C6XRT6_FRAOC|nr:uncharacterized protein LOC127750613 [Frankliniella occidentalis]
MLRRSPLCFMFADREKDDPAFWDVFLYKLLSRTDVSITLSCDGQEQNERIRPNYILAGSPAYVLNQVLRFPRDTASRDSLLLVLLQQSKRNDSFTHGSNETFLSKLCSRYWRKVVVASENREKGVKPAGTRTISVSLVGLAPSISASKRCGDFGAHDCVVEHVPLLNASSIQYLTSSVYPDMVSRQLDGCLVHADMAVDESDTLCGSSKAPSMEHMIVDNIITSVAHYRNIYLKKNKSKDAGYGDPINETFSGSLGRLQSGLTDVALAAYALTPNRVRLLQPSAPFLDVTSRVHVRVQCSDTSDQVLSVSVR